MITREIKEYGEGTYRLTFKARACQKGQLRVGFEHETWEYQNVDRKFINVDETWSEQSFDLVADHRVVDANSILFAFCNGDEIIPTFDICDIELIKL